MFTKNSFVILFVGCICSANAVESPFLDLYKVADEKCQTKFNLTDVQVSLVELLNDFQFNATAKPTDIQTNSICYMQCLAANLGIIDENGWHQVIVDDFLKFGEEENYKTEVENELKKDGPHFAQLGSICSFRQATRNLMVDMWMNLISQINVLRIISFIDAKPQYKTLWESMIKKWSCLAGVESVGN
ncbi:uncharacterized protein LOC129575131 [Sitodiplosis mosellana]|uniref:uncharacterized protein LOC129575131 n=1 Tax=Sitodiplosis mosellana TaxID=263140 RepID=UPI002443FD75|nr:uncharacterized protein LOC129575131 [Sitodiplosis mosellana]